jgi:hypothetical protein
LNDKDRGMARVLGEKLVPVSKDPIQIPHKVVWDLNLGVCSVGPAANRLCNGMASDTYTYSSPSDGLVALTVLSCWLPGHNLRPTVPVYRCVRSSGLSSTHPTVQ